VLKEGGAACILTEACGRSSFEHLDFSEKRIPLFGPVILPFRLEGKHAPQLRRRAKFFCPKFPIAKKKARHEALQLNASDPFSGNRRQRDNRA
jgi:hypothetical protein